MTVGLTEPNEKSDVLAENQSIPMIGRMKWFEAPLVDFESLFSTIKEYQQILEKHEKLYPSDKGNWVVGMMPDNTDAYNNDFVEGREYIMVWLAPSYSLEKERYYAPPDFSELILDMSISKRLESKLIDGSKDTNPLLSVTK
jgi:hypothetical protein